MFFQKKGNIWKFQQRISSYYKDKKRRKIWRWIGLLVFFSPSIVYFVWTYLFFAVKVRGTGMLPTFQEGQWLFVSRLAYGQKKIFRHDMPRNRNSEPKIARGDIVAFLNPKQPQENLVRKLFDYPVYALTFGFVKLSKRPVVVRRILGLPKERLIIKNKKIYINDQFYDLPWKIISRDTMTYDAKISSRDNIHSFFVPGGYVFVINDNWDVISDSRSFSLVPIYRIEGKVLHSEK